MGMSIRIPEKQQVQVVLFRARIQFSRDKAVHLQLWQASKKGICHCYSNNELS